MDLDAERIDLAFRVQAALRDSSFFAHKLMDLEVDAYASPAYLRTHRPPRVPADLAQHRVSAFHVAKPRAKSRATRSKDKYLLSEPTAFRANDGASLREIALGGGGVVFIPRMLARVADFSCNWRLGLPGKKRRRASQSSISRTRRAVLD